MKLLLIVFGLVLFVNCKGQTDTNIFTVDTSRHIPKGANVIYVQNNDFKKVCTALLDAGFTIDKKDEELLTVETKQSKTDDVWVPILSIRIKEGVTIIRPKIFSKQLNFLMDGQYDQTSKGKPRSNAIVHAFLQGYKVAKLTGGNIECKKE